MPILSVVLSVIVLSECALDALSELKSLDTGMATLLPPFPPRHKMSRIPPPLPKDWIKNNFAHTHFVFLIQKKQKRKAKKKKKR
jgi:hypothetical protein